MHKHKHNSSDFQDFAFEVSAYIWLPYTLFMLYLFYEHKKRNQYPQYLIIGFLAVGCVLRTIWLWNIQWKYMLGYQLTSRFAILLQFSGLCLLMLMWGRALKVAKTIDLNIATILKNEVVSKAEIIKVVSLNSKSRNRELSNEYNRVKRSQQEKLLAVKQFFLLMLNIAAYVTVIITICLEQSQFYYDLNNELIAVVCLIVNLGILAVGIKNWYELRRDFAPVFVNESVSSHAQPVGRKKFDGFYLQWQVIRVVMTVSVIVAFFFSFRAFCFAYHSFLEPKFGRFEVNDEAIYPLFYYQFPEFFPNLAIAYGISPPKGVLRVAVDESMAFVISIITCSYFKRRRTNNSIDSVLTSAANPLEIREDFSIVYSSPSRDHPLAPPRVEEEHVEEMDDENARLLQQEYLYNITAFEAAPRDYLRAILHPQHVDVNKSVDIEFNDHSLSASDRSQSVVVNDAVTRQSINWRENSMDLYY